jgi:uncharacterized protein with FMN-binding domain
MTELRRKITALLGAALFAVPAADASVAARHPKKPTHAKPAPKKPAAPTKKPVTPPKPPPAPTKPVVDVVTKAFTGTREAADQWGFVQVNVTIEKTTTTTGKDTTVAKKITAVDVPEVPHDAARSAYISSTAIPHLVRATLFAQDADILLVGGATYTSEAYLHSLQAALLLAQKF